MNKKLLIILTVFILILFVVGVAILLGNNANNSTGKSNNATVQKQNQAQTEKIIAESANIVLTASGFNPQSVTVKPGGRVVWTNQSGEQASVNSDPYPTNSLWKFLNLGLFDNQNSVSVIFEKAGKYTYHNQLIPSQTGTVIVQ